MSRILRVVAWAGFLGHLFLSMLYIATVNPAGAAFSAVAMLSLALWWPDA